MSNEEEGYLKIKRGVLKKYQKLKWSLLYMVIYAWTLYDFSTLPCFTYAIKIKAYNLNPQTMRQNGMYFGSFQTLLNYLSVEVHAKIKIYII